MKLVSLGYTEGLGDKPCIDMELLREYREGIIALTGALTDRCRIFLPQIGEPKPSSVLKHYLI